MNVTLNGDAIQVSAVLTDAEAVDKLIRVLQANKPLLPEKLKAEDEKKARFLVAFKFLTMVARAPPLTGAT